MKIGMGTYALFWEWNHRNPHPLTTARQLDRAAELGCEVFQICDDPTIPGMDDSHLVDLARHARDLGLSLELGTRGTQSDHLREYLRKASLLGADTLRSMVQRTEIASGPGDVICALTDLVPLLDNTGITLALETYEQVPTATLVEIIRAVDSPRVGICLDPANCVSALEHPAEVIAATAPHVTNLHVKDFAFVRNEGWVGFTYAGAELGTGLLDLDAELRAVYAAGRDPSAIVEHWVVWDSDIDTTITTERRWTLTALDMLRTWRTAAHP